MKKKKDKKKYEIGLSTTTMVDVLFILLIFFVLVSTVKKDNIQINAAKVQKQVQQNMPNKAKQEYVLTIDKENKIYLNGKSVETEENLEQTLEQLKQNQDPDKIPVIVLRPDANSTSNRLIEIFAVLGKVGLSDYVKIEVESK